ncbi:MAG: DNA mismatch repair endonuclease MutL [Armatimonadota bacterium]|nr:DNA mismatch repair endonuclease MutL [Armatimonadota bacterium]MDR7519946.1 DNA mismatch repair endonuclease MutL [Armatimonadota bacterium]MDR7548415.1 DNA mismatch repair endonuclease MutL [Armatimonadota bacterium]
MRAIRVLERSVADRIAAGEVIERPASAVKELIENSLDAGARSVSVEVEGAGLRRIRVTDDGEGIPAEEVPRAFERFATSKIATVEDLGAIRTYGFRGEALPSIAAVARVTLTTRARDAGQATRIEVAGGVVESLGPHGAPPGTTVEVTRLFYNTPARMKFLKSPIRELALIAEVVQRMAMARHDVSFRLWVDGREAGRWPAASAIERVADLLGAGSAEALLPLEGIVPGGRAEGWLARPERTRPTRAGQYLFVNRRPVQSSLLRRAVEQGYAQLLPVGRFPIFAVFLEVDPGTVDVNMHPRKLDVRFADEGRMFGAVAHLTREALVGSPLVRRVTETMAPVPAALGGAASSPPGPFVLEAHEPSGRYERDAARRLPALRPLGQLLDTYILAEGPDGLYLIDQHAAHERVLYERLLAARRQGGVASQGLAVPLALEVTPAEMATVAGHLDHLATLGFAVELFGSRTLLLRAVPAPGRGAADALLHRAIAAIADERAGDDALERLTIATACHTAIRAGDRLGPDAVAALLADLAATEDPFTCFHGRPTIVAVTRADLERWFLRR